MKTIAVAFSMTLLTMAASAQTLPKMPGATMPSMTTPNASSLAGTSGASSNPIDAAKTELECKIPTNAVKPECIARMLGK